MQNEALDDLAVDGEGGSHLLLRALLGKIAHVHNARQAVGEERRLQGGGQLGESERVHVELQRGQELMWAQVRLGLAAGGQVNSELAAGDLELAVG